MGFLYRLEFSSGKSYIGITESTPELRFKDHKGSAIKRGSKCLVHKAWRKHGEPQLIVLAVVENKHLRSAEQKAIQVFGTMVPGGYNMTPGGEIAPSSIPEIAAKIAIGRTGKRHSEETKARISKLKTGIPSPRKGATHSDESKAKMSASRKGVKQTEIHRIRSSISKATVWAKKQGREFCEVTIRRSR